MKNDYFPPLHEILRSWHSASRRGSCQRAIRLTKNLGIWLIPIIIFINLSATVSAQSIQAGTGAPAQDIHVSNEPRTFTVTILGGPTSSGTVTIALPVGYAIVPGSINSTGITATAANISGNTGTVNLSAIPGVNNTASFTYNAYATCSAIQGTENQASYVFTPNGGTAQPAVKSNSFNLVYAKMNIRELSNSPAGAGVVGDNYVRTYKVVNNGFGTIDTVYVTDISGIGVQHLSHTVSNTNNGATVDASLVSSNTSGSNTTYTYRFIIHNLIKDDYFIFTQNLKVISCTDLNTNLNAWYGTGPNATPCVGQNGTETTALAVDNGKQPTLAISSTSSAQLTCRGVAKQQEFKVVNSGAAPAKNVKVRLYHAWGANSALPSINSTKFDQVGFITESFKYKIGATGTYANVAGSADVALTNPTYYSQASCLNTTAPAWIDIVIPEIAAGQEIYLQYQEQNCCNSECSGSLLLGTQARIQYYNACGSEIKNNLTSGNGDILRNSSGGNSNFFEDFPTDISAGTAYTLKWETTQLSLPTDIYPAGSTVRFQITLPTGLVYSGDKADIYLRTKSGANALPTSVTYTGNVLSITYTTGGINFPASTAHDKGVLVVPNIFLDCQQVTTASGTVNTKWFYRSKDCVSCEEQVSCGDQSIDFHCDATCETGLANNSFTIFRRNYGSPDVLNNGTANGSAFNDMVRNNWVSRGDTLDFTFTGTVADKGTTIHNFKFGYAKFTIPDATAAHLSALYATIRITNNDGTITKATLNNYPLSYSSTSTLGSGSIDFSIDKLITSGVSGYTQFADNDKIIITVAMKVTNGIGGMLNATTVGTDFYLSDAANASGANADKWKCGGFSGAYTLVGLLIPATNTGTTSGTECNDINVSGSAGFNVGQHVNNGGPGTNYYRNEFRQLGVPGNYVVTIPTGYTLVSMAFRYQNTSSNYGFNTNWITNIVPDSVSGQAYIYNIRKQFADKGGPWALPDEGFSVVYSAVIRPSCESPVSSVVTATLQILPGTQLKETLPADKFTSGSVIGVNLTKSQLAVTANAPVQTVSGNTVSWIVQVASTQPSTTPKVWMGENDGTTNGVTVQSVQQVSSDGINTIGSPLAATNGIYQLGTFNGGNKYYRITATFTNCSSDQLPVAVGYVCGNYPTSVASASCKIVTNLTVIPTGANLQVSLIEQPKPTYPDSPGAATGTVDLCQELQYTAEVKNPAPGTAYDLKFTILKPAGLAYIANSYALSPTILPATANLVAVNNDAVDVSETPTTLTFSIPASVVANLPYNTGYTIRYKLKTVACDFISGTKMTLQALGINGCGSAIIGTRQQTQTIRIKGEILNPNLYAISSSISAPVEACSPVNPTYTFVAVNNGSSASKTGETIRIKIPKPFALGTTTDISNFSTGASLKTTSDATSTTYTWTLPSGIAPGATLSFSAPVTSEDLDATSCGETAAIHEMIAYTFLATCVSDGTVCTGNLQSEGENETTTITVQRPEFTVTNVTAAQSRPGQLYGTVTIANANAGVAGTPQPGTVNIYHDSNNNGVIDANDVFVGTQAVTLESGATQNAIFDITTTHRGDLCPALVEVIVDCACSSPAIYKYTCNVSLPVRLSNFSVTRSENVASIHWTTTSETNSSYFEVERSSDAKNWHAIERVLAKGESVNTINYDSKDSKPLAGVNYYRLKMVDLDNSVAYSQIRSASFEGSTSLVYPNPFEDKISLDNLELSKVSKIEVINMNGVSILKVNKPATKFILTDKLGAGVYIIKITYLSGETAQQKVVKK